MDTQTTKPSNPLMWIVGLGFVIFYAQAWLLPLLPK